MFLDELVAVVYCDGRVFDTVINHGIVVNMTAGRGGFWSHGKAYSLAKFGGHACDSLESFGDDGGLGHVVGIDWVGQVREARGLEPYEGRNSLPVFHACHAGYEWTRLTFERGLSERADNFHRTCVGERWKGAGRPGSLGDLPDKGIAQEKSPEFVGIHFDVARGASSNGRDVRGCGRSG